MICLYCILMRKILIFLILLLVITSASALDCTDTDNGPTSARGPDDYSLGTPGTVTQGIFGNTRDDACVSSDDDATAVTLKTGYYLREYYCKDNKREFEIYTCSDYGFTGCENAACVGKDVLSNQSQSAPATVESLCGNSIVDAGESCDPPFEICFGKDISEYGQCNIKCFCELANVENTKCGNGIVDSGEACEQTSDCETNELCKNCVCIQNPAVPVVTTNETETKEVADKVVPEEKKEIEETIEAKNLTEMPGIGFTKSIANFFKSIWNGIIGIFS